MTDTAPDDEGGEDGWGAAALRALRGRARLTQEALANAAGIDRTVVIALEKNRRTMSRYYADALAPHLDAQPEDLLEPAEPVTGPEHPFALLQGLLATVDQQQETIEGLERKVEALERAVAKPRRATGGP